MELEMGKIDIDKQEQIARLKQNMASVIRGKDEAIELSLVALFAGGHLLLEDIPGVGKTLLAMALARSIRCSYRRIQFTNDTVPADILGMMVYSRKEERFRFVSGPIFAGVVLADEINRTSSKTQSALLEAMTEKKVSIENKVFKLPDPFIVIATQNPIEYIGTFPLPESQLDRFLLRTSMGYPSRDSEREILLENLGADTARLLPAVIDDKQVLQIQQEVCKVQIESTVLEYLLELIEATRNDSRLALGVSPRGSLMLKKAAQALAYIKGRDFVTPDDIKYLVKPVWGHRIKSSGTSLKGSVRQSEAEMVLQDIINQTKVPV